MTPTPTEIADSKPALAKEFDALADRAAVAFPEQMEIQHHACALLGRWALNHRAEISRALGGAVGDRYAEGYAAAREDAAKAFDEAAAQFSHSALDADLSYAQVCRDHATATRALKPQGGEE